MPVIKTLKLENYDTEYFQVGNGQKIIVLVPGLGRNLNIWFKVARKLKKHYKIYAFTLPNYATNIPRGRRFDLTDQGWVIQDFLNHFKIKQPIVVGHSLGALTCLDFAIHNPQMVLKLVLISPPLANGKPNVPKRWLWTAMAVLQISFLDSILKHSVLQTKRALDFLSRRLNSPTIPKIDYIDYLFKKVPPRSLAQFYYDIFNSDLSQLLKKNKRPTLIIFGKKDYALNRFYPGEKLLAQKNYQTRWLNCSHYPPRECPIHTVKLIREFVKPTKP